MVSVCAVYQVTDRHAISLQHEIIVGKDRENKPTQQLKVTKFGSLWLPCLVNAVVKRESERQLNLPEHSAWNALGTQLLTRRVVMDDIGLFPVPATAVFPLGEGCVFISLFGVLKTTARGEFGSFLHREMAVPVTILKQGCIIQRIWFWRAPTDRLQVQMGPDG